MGYSMLRTAVKCEDLEAGIKGRMMRIDIYVGVGDDVDAVE